MCTRPDRHSISTSAHALWDAALSLTFACGALLLALVSAPLRLLERRRPKSRRAATVGHVDVQVHLEDRKCVAEIKRVLRQTLRLTARTWAPLTLPIDRVVVGVGFPPGGRADVYDKFPTQNGKASAPGSSRPLVVVSLGVRDGERDLEPAEVACALAAQIQSVINERYGQRATTVAVSAQPSTNITLRDLWLQLVRASRHRRPNRPSRNQRRVQVPAVSLIRASRVCRTCSPRCNRASHLTRLAPQLRHTNP